MGKRKLTAVMFTDIKGYTSLMSLDEQNALNIINKSKEQIIKSVELFNGRFIKEMGDGTMSVFQSATDAVHCAKAIQYELADEEYKLRIGIHLGEIVHEHKDVYGDGVNIASRIEPLAPPGGIAISGEMYSALKSHSDISVESMGEKSLKNVSRPVSLFSVAVDDVFPSSQKRRKRNNKNFNKTQIKALYVLLPLVIIASVLIVTLFVNDEPAIAVLPFDNFTGMEDQEYFADAITEMITSKTAQIRSLRVISRTSVMPYKTEEASLKEIADTLKVHYVLEGSVLRDGDRIRIVAQLIQVRPEKHLWREEYDRDFKDTLALMNDIAKSIAGEIQIALSQEEEAIFAIAPPVDSRAFIAYEKGRFQLSRNTPDSNDRAVDLFRESLTYDEKFVSAYAGLSTAYLRRFVLGGGDLSEALILAEQYAEEALEIDNNNPEAIEAYAYLLVIKRKYEKAEKEFLRALELRPSFAVARSHYAELLEKTGAFNEAIEQLELAREIDPVNLDYDLRIGWNYFNQGRYKDAAKQAQYVLKLDPDNQMAMINLLMSYNWLGKYGDVLDMYEEVKVIFDDNSSNILRDTLFYARVMSGRFSDEQIGKELHDLEDLYNKDLYQPYMMAIAYYITDSRDAAFEALEKGYSTNDSAMYFLKDDIWDEDFREDPRYISLYERIYSDN